MKNYVVVDSRGWFQNNELNNYFENKNFFFIGDKKELTIEKLGAIEPEYIFFLHWSWKVNSEIHKKFKCIVFHTAPLPFGRGGSPIQNLILLGFQFSPVCALKMTDEIDGGPIYLKKELSLSGNLSEIFSRLSLLVEEMIKEICNSEIIPLPQEDKNIFYFKRLTYQDNNINFSNSLQSIYDQIRMVDGYDYPKAFLDKGEYKIEFYNSNYLKETIFSSVKISKKTTKPSDTFNQGIRKKISFSLLDIRSIEQISFLFELLKAREHNISHSKMPTMQEHKEFVKNNPYLYWYLIQEDSEYIGSTYIMEDNCIGIDLKDDKIFYFQDVINYLKKRHKPKPPIKSMRSGSFFINVSPRDYLKIDALEKTSSRIIQSTYIIN